MSANESARLSGARALIKSLEHEGVDTIFGYPGLAMLLFIAAAGILHLNLIRTLSLGLTGGP